MTQRYDSVAIALHWTIALLILIAFGLGLTVDDFPKGYGPMVVNIHSLLGLGVLVLTLVRLAWRLTHTPPAHVSSGGPLADKAAKAVHVLMYVLMLAVPLIGLPTLFYRGRGLDFGFFAIPAFLPRVPEIFRPLTEVHELAAYALVALAAGHVLAAIYHQVVLKDRLMQRMLPGHN